MTYTFEYVMPESCVTLTWEEGLMVLGEKKSKLSTFAENIQFFYLCFWRKMTFNNFDRNLACKFILIFWQIK